MEPSSRTPEGEPNRCPICGHDVRIEPSSGFRDAPCPHCGYLLRFSPESVSVSPAGQEAVQRLYESAVHCASKGEFEQAADLLGVCVLCSPDNLLYARSYIESLKKRFGSESRPAATPSDLDLRRRVQMAQVGKQWRASLPDALRLLRTNPWDVPTLLSIATAIQHLVPLSEVELYYLKCALEVDTKSPETNRQCALAMSERRQYDQALACWLRVEAVSPDDEEARQAIHELMIVGNARPPYKGPLGH